MESLRTFTTGQMAREIIRSLREKREKERVPDRWRYPVESWVVDQVVTAGRLTREAAGTYVRRPGIPVQYDLDPVFSKLDQFSTAEGKRGLHFRLMELGFKELGTAKSRLLSEPH